MKKLTLIMWASAAILQAPLGRSPIKLLLSLAISFPDTQDQIAHVVLRLAGVDHEPPVPLTSEEQAAIAASKAAAARSEFSTDERVRAVWAKHGL
jgi:hypothetical protein